MRTKYTTCICNLKKKKITLNYPKSAAMGFFPRDSKKRVRNSRDKRAISIRATEVLLYFASLTREAENRTRWKGVNAKSYVVP